jgi:hypothetical protein
MVVICVTGARESLLLLLLKAQTNFGPAEAFIQSVNRGNLSLVVKPPVREAEHWPVFSAEVKNKWIYDSTPT